MRRAADEALTAFDGFLGSELLAGPDGTWTLLVRWASHRAKRPLLNPAAAALEQGGSPEVLYSTLTGLPTAANL